MLYKPLDRVVSFFLCFYAVMTAVCTHIIDASVAMLMTCECASMSAK